MQMLWKLKKAFVKDIIRELPEPKPPYNTVSSIIRILEEKGMVGHEAFGKTHQYHPLVSKSTYSQKVFRSLVKDYFDGSVSQAMSLMIKEKELTQEELASLKNLIKKIEK